MKHTLAFEFPLLMMVAGIGLVGFFLSIVWGKITRTRMTEGTIRMLAGVWIGIALFGMILAFIL